MKMYPVCTLLLSAVLASAAAPALAQQPASTPRTERTIRVTGVGEVLVTPDEARIDFSVETVGATARAASDANSRTMERVIAALTGAGVPRRDIETRGFSVSPNYEPDTLVTEGTPMRPGRPRPRGYRVGNAVSLRTGALERVGPLIDVALGAGANRVNGIRFGLRNSETAQAEASRRAVQKARQTAETIAAALGVRLGPVLDASTSAGRPQFYGGEMAFATASGGRDMMPPPPPIQPGERTVAAVISVVFAIEGAR